MRSSLSPEESSPNPRRIYPTMRRRPALELTATSSSGRTIIFPTRDSRIIGGKSSRSSISAVGRNALMLVQTSFQKCQANRQPSSPKLGWCHGLSELGGSTQPIKSNPKTIFSRNSSPSYNPLPFKTNSTIYILYIAIIVKMSLSNPTNTNRPTPNITPDSASLHLGSSIHINAPSTAVWEVLTNTSTWPKWNSFVPRVTIVSQPDSPSTTSTNEPLSPILQKGTRVTFHVRMDPTSTKPQAATDAGLVVTEYVAPNSETGTAGRIVWASDFEAPGTMGPSLLTAEREHEVKDVEGGTEVRNWELQVGWIVWVVKMMYGGKLKQNFDLWVQDLKAFVEGEGESGQ